MVVKTYADFAKSGLVLKSRNGLCQLLRDIVEGRANYKAVLVYDVSRWGRFQDDDEAACYEFLCRSAGIAVRYCAETFMDDGSASSSLLKHMRRIMAAEFSRELSTRVFDIHVRYAKLGFWTGGPPPYGFNRVLVSCDKQPLRVLKAGERKGDYRSRVVLAPGPDCEVKCVQLIFRLFVENRFNCRQIADELNRRNMARRSIAWRASSVWRLLHHPSYTGCNIWNRTTGRLRTRRTPEDPERWVRMQGAFQGIVEQSRFDRAQRILKEGKWPKAKLLKKIRQVIAAGGKLTHKGMRIVRGAPSPATIRKHFGSVLEAYRFVGCDVPAWVRKKADRIHATHVIAEDIVRQLIAASKGKVTLSRRWPRLTVRLNDGIEASVIASRSRATATGKLRWDLHPIVGWNGPILCCRLNANNNGYHSLYVLPPFRLQAFRRIGEDDQFLAEIGRLENLTGFCDAVRAVSTRSAERLTATTG